MDVLNDYSKARARFDSAAEFDKTDRLEAENDMNFLGGQQWDVEAQRERTQVGRPALVINQLPKFVRQVTNEARLSEVSIQVLPVDSDDDATAQVVEGLVKSIESESEAETIYDTGLEHAAQCGRGAFRVLTEYVSDESFDQCIRLGMIDDPQAVYWDPKAKRYDKADAEYCFVVDWIDKEEFAEKYKREGKDWESDEGGSATWFREDEVRVAEYWYKEHRYEKLWLLADGTVVRPSEDPRDKEAFEMEGRPVVSEREVDVVTVYRRLMDGADFLEKPEEFPSKYIPIIPVMGPKIKVEGEIQYWSVIRWQKTPQQMYNLWGSTISEKARLSPLAPWIATPSMVAGREKMWENANRKNFATLLYTPDQEAPGMAPQRTQPAFVNEAEIGLLMQARNDLMDTAGIYNAGLGDQGNEISGKAIQARQSESDVGTLDWIDNLHRSIRQAGRVMVDMIPKVYDTERMVRIIGRDEAAEYVMINGEENQLTVNKYDVRIDTGPTFKTQREEAANNLVTLLGAVPQFAGAITDLAVKNMDFKDSDRAADRIAFLSGWKQEPPEGDEVQQPPQDPNAEMDVAKAQADLEGKQLVNMQRRLDLAEDVKQRQLLLQQMQQITQMLSGGQPMMGPGQ
jgi:hypothetical protein